MSFALVVIMGGRAACYANLAPLAGPSERSILSIGVASIVYQFNQTYAQYVCSLAFQMREGMCGPAW